jgi:hypothetical protein
MLEQLVNEIRASGVTAPATLAARLDVSPALVQAMLEHLARLGQLKEMSGCDQGACRACATASTCHPNTHGEPRAWVLVNSALDRAR